MLFRLGDEPPFAAALDGAVLSPEQNRQKKSLRFFSARHGMCALKRIQGDP
jgi:hypothetical protein